MIANCPFCDADHHRVRFCSSRRRMECTRCGGAGPRASSKAEAVDRWNIRPGETDHIMQANNLRAELQFRERRGEQSNDTHSHR